MIRQYIQFIIPQPGDECPDCRKPFDMGRANFLCLRDVHDNHEIWRKCEDCARKVGW